VNPIYEYIAAFFVMTLVVGYSLYSLNTMSSTQLSIAQESQLRPAAGRLFDKILLTKGYPEDWGSNIYINDSNLGDFGLSSQYGEMYRVNVDKLMRLVSKVDYTENPLYIFPTTMGNLTGIYGNDSWSYGFRLLVKSALIINITYDPDVFPMNSSTISVVNYLGRSASNAVVNATYFYIYTYHIGNDDFFDYNYTVAGNITDWQGRTVLDCKVPTTEVNTDKEAYVLFVTVNYYGLQSQQIAVIKDMTKNNPKILDTISLLIQGEHLIANYSDIEDVAHFSHGAMQLDFTLIEFTSNQQVIVNPILEDTNGVSGAIINSGHGQNSYKVYNLTNPLTEDVVFAGLIVKKNGVWTLALCDRPMVPIAIDYRSHSYAYAGINSEAFSRLVRIGSNSYYAELTVWRMSQ